MKSVFLLSYPLSMWTNHSNHWFKLSGNCRDIQLFLLILRCCTQTTTICANLTHRFNSTACLCMSPPLSWSASEYSFRCTLVASPLSFTISFILSRNTCFFSSLTTTHTQCYSGYVLFVKVPAGNVYNLFFFAYINIYTVCMCVCMYNGCVQFNYQLLHSRRVSDLLDISFCLMHYPVPSMGFCTPFVKEI